MPVLDETLTWKGTWAVGVDYVIDDAVIDSPDLVYVCTADNTSDLTNRPPNSSFWELVADTPAAEAYASVAFYRSRSDKIEDSEDSIIADDLIAMTRLIDMRVFGQGSANRFTKDSSPQSRIFVPRISDILYGPFHRSRLEVDDLVSVSTIAIDENFTGTFSKTLAAGDYELLPLNALQGGEPRPYRQIHLTEWGTYGGWIPGSRIRITGIWGWPAIPQPVVRACVELTRLLRLATPRATSTMTDFGTVVGQSAQARNIIDELVSNYSRPSL
jgi:hypothetical protein